MGRSLDFCKSIAKDPERSKISDVDFTNATEYNNTIILLKSILNVRSLNNLTAPWNTNIKYSIEYDNNANYDYFTCKQVICDGTLYFYDKTMLDALNNVAMCNTYCIPKGLAKNGETIKYTVGDIILIEEHGCYSDKEPWMSTRVTAMLPIKYERNRQRC